MDYDKIILELLSRIQKLEADVAEMKEKGIPESEKQPKEVKSSKKYQKLSDFLKNSGQESVTLTFDEIRKILGFLPESAKYRACWANTETHSISRAWMSVGYLASDVDMENEKVTLIKAEE